MSLSVFTRSALNLLFPPQCACCGCEVDGLGGPLLCEECLRDFLPSKVKRCQRCGARVPEVAPASDRCTACRKKNFAFQGVLPLGSYTGQLRKAILRTKRAGQEPLTMALAEFLWKSLQLQVSAIDADVVAPVPMHWRRRAYRGSNSAEVMAEVISRKLGIPAARGLLVRSRNTLPQNELPPSARLRNVRGAFRLGAGYALDAARVLLVDDILTTGATCSEAAKTLQSSGADQVWVAVFARTEGEVA